MINDNDKKWLGPHLTSVLLSLYKIEADVINGPRRQLSVVEGSQKISEIEHMVKNDPGYDDARKRLFLFESEGIRVRIAKIVLGVDVTKLNGAGYTPLSKPKFFVRITWESKNRPEEQFTLEEEPVREAGWILITQSPSRTIYIPMAKVTTMTVERQ